MSVLLLLERHLGHETFAVNLLNEARSFEELTVTDVPITYNTTTSRLPGWSPLARVRGTLAGRREVRSGLRTNDADVWVYNTQVPAALAGRQRRRPYVVITDITPAQYDRLAQHYGHRADRSGPLAAWKHRVNRRVFGEAAWCVPWSAWVADSLRDEYDVPAERIAVVPPGVDLDAWHFSRGARSPGDPLRVLFVGGDFVRKGGDVLLSAIAGLSDRVEVDVVTRSEVPPSSGVRVFRDMVPNDERLRQLYRSADVFVLPTRAEAFGIAAVEASAAGLPVIASRIGGLTDVVRDGETGYLLGPDDHAGLAVALDRLCHDEDLRLAMGAAAREHAERHFSAATNATRLLQLVKRAADVGTGRDEFGQPAGRPDSINAASASFEGSSSATPR